jgi:hypothetical protein
MEPIYYLLFGERQRGPYRADELLEAGLENDTLVWYAGREGWVRADKLVKLHDILEAGRKQRKQRKQRRKMQRQVAQLPEPEVLRKWSRIAILCDLPAGASYVLGTALLLAAGVLFFLSAAGERPDAAAIRGLGVAIWVTGIGGLVLAGLGGLLTAIELGALAAFTWNCRRIVQALSPHGQASQIEGRAVVQDMIDAVDVSDSVDGTVVMVIFIVLVVVFGPCGALLLLAAFSAVLIVLLVPLIVFAICSAVFLVPYLWLGFSIYRLGFGLNRVVNDCPLKVPWAPVSLAFWVALCGLLILFGPLSVPFFVLAPIWARKTAATAIAICEQRFAAADEPTSFVEELAPPASKDSLEGPDIV